LKKALAKANAFYCVSLTKKFKQVVIVAQ